ncbi:HesA/MoeB/ThiF family protein [Pedobacter metabolipauper]|uniref:Molybdopterin-synthase adenylyltransferase n=1 Tax=Pedobacter metabolipauper TaxID=425513 RepID=A0A4R6SZ50_9SPHI|nr:HesA/MoeB/ThiF family protein [Pedobacter metabolipauper]TDQ11332.1 adenylyltransferase/sulfurtransferase [Pedobacter metabolipauper]
MSMNSNELKTYERQIALSEIGIDGQLKLKAASILVIGAGGLGCPVLLYLVAAGIGKIGVVDDDTVDVSNLHRQILFHTADLGNSKSETAVKKLQLLNPNAVLKAYHLRVIQNNAKELLEAYDLIIDGSDNFSTRYLINDTCMLLNKPFISGSIFKFEGQISIFNYQGGPDYRSLYPEAPVDAPNCGESGVLGTLPGTIGTLMANEAIKLICGFGDILSGKLLIYNALDNSSVILNLAKAAAKTEQVKASEDYPVLDPKVFNEWKNNNEDLYLIDVREAYEFEEYNIGGTNIPLHNLGSPIETITGQTKIILCCTSGLRSKIAYRLLKDKISQEIYLLNLNDFD